jgi:hypothetical protein
MKGEAYIYEYGNFKSSVIFEEDKEEYWKRLKHQAMIAAMPIANHVIDGLIGGDYHNDKNRTHTIDAFVNECEAIAAAMIAKMKEEEK